MCSHIRGYYHWIPTLYIYILELLFLGIWISKSKKRKFVLKQTSNKEILFPKLLLVKSKICQIDCRINYHLQNLLNQILTFPFNSIRSSSFLIELFLSPSTRTINTKLLHPFKHPFTPNFSRWETIYKTLCSVKQNLRKERVAVMPPPLPPTPFAIVILPLLLFLFFFKLFPCFTTWTMIQNQLMSFI